MSNSEDLWKEFIVEIELQLPDRPKVSVCGLCGSKGIIDTRDSVRTPTGDITGILAFCICPTGRAIKQAGLTRTK